MKKNKKNIEINEEKSYKNMVVKNFKNNNKEEEETFLQKTIINILTTISSPFYIIFSFFKEFIFNKKNNKSYE